MTLRQEEASTIARINNMTELLNNIILDLFYQYYEYIH